MERLVSVLMVLVVSVCAQAGLTDTDVETALGGEYIEAVMNGNTPLVTGWNTQSSNTAIGGDSLQGTEGAGLLTSTFAGIDDTKSYDVYVVYYSRVAANYDWYNYAALAGDSMVLCDETTADQTLITVPITTSDTLAGHVKKIGTISEVSSFTVNIGAPEVGSLDRRAWYDGVAIVEVPEPATLLILGMGVAMGLLRRK